MRRRNYDRMSDERLAQLERSLSTDLKELTKETQRAREVELEWGAAMEASLDQQPVGYTSVLLGEKGVQVAVYAYRTAAEALGARPGARWQACALVPLTQAGQ